MFGISISHLLIVLAVVVLVGPEKAATALRSLAIELKKFRTQIRFDKVADSPPKEKVDLNTFAENKIEKGAKLWVRDGKTSQFDELEEKRT